MEFETAPQDRVDRYEAEVERILQALGYRLADCAVSDESLLTDFAESLHGKLAKG